VITGGGARDVGIREWQRSRPGAQDRLIFPADVRLSPQARARRTEFGEGQWAVAWDDPRRPGVFSTGGYCTECGRGTAGIASQQGGVDPTQNTRFEVSWNDGAKAGYGPVAAVRDDSTEVPDAQWRALIAVPGHSSGYILWTYNGREHLEHLIGHLRFVAGAP
jgi:hypothetical protein